MAPEAALGTAAALPHRVSLCNACLFRLHTGMKRLTHCAGAGGGEEFPQALCAGWALLPLKQWGGRGAHCFPMGEDLGQGWALQKSPTPKICNNRKLNPTVTPEKRDDVIAWGTPSCFHFAMRAACALGKVSYMFTACWNIFHCLGKNSEVPKSPSSHLSHFLSAVSADGYAQCIGAPGISQKLKYCSNYNQDVQGAERPFHSRWQQPTMSCNQNIKYYYFCMLCLGRHAKE